MSEKPSAWYGSHARNARSASGPKRLKMELPELIITGIVAILGLRIVLSPPKKKKDKEAERRAEYYGPFR
jgi:hypothetical protein